MFTGIITDIGNVLEVKPTPAGVQAKIATSYNLKEVDIGASIACDGVCLTVTKKGDKFFLVDISEETLRCTTLENWRKDHKVNLERSLKIGDELGGHLVSGHVDGVGQVLSHPADGVGSWQFEVSSDLAKYIAVKGSVTINGVSLTVNEVDANRFSVNIIPHTMENTTFLLLLAGDKVNVEIDRIARYIERMIEFDKGNK